jgi:hypothetical protein
MKQAVKKTLGIAALGAAFTAAGAGVAAADTGVTQEARHAGLAGPEAAAPSPLENAGKAIGVGQYTLGKAGLGSLSSLQPKAATDTLPSSGQGNRLGGLPLNGLPAS